MKKIILSTCLGIATCLSSMGQGYFTFANTATTAVMDNFTTPGTNFKSTNSIVAIMWSANLGAVINSFGAASSSNGTAASWAGVTSDPNFHIAMSNGVAFTAPTRVGISAGTFNGGVVGIDGTNPGDTVRLYVISWRASDGIGGFGHSGILGWSNPLSEALPA
jgi:hypothetical protein